MSLEEVPAFWRNQVSPFPRYNGHGLVAEVGFRRKRRGMYSGLTREQERRAIF
jgi:hypothetical protein